MISSLSIHPSLTINDVKQIEHAFLEHSRHRKSQRKIKGRANRGHRGDDVGIEGKRHSDPDSNLECRLNLGKFHH